MHLFICLTNQVSCINCHLSGRKSVQTIPLSNLSPLSHIGICVCVSFTSMFDICIICVSFGQSPDVESRMVTLWMMMLWMTCGCLFQALQALGVDHIQLAAVDYVGTPSQGDIATAISFIDLHRSHGHSVYIHCKAGRTRSATVVACYLCHVCMSWMYVMYICPV